MNTVNSFWGKKIAIIGDVVADQFLNGTITRVSREAPVFIMRHDETETRPGGAANAAANVASLGGIPLLVGLTGTDINGAILLRELEGSGIGIDRIVKDESYTTTTKVRVLAGHRHAPRNQVIRIDHEPSLPISSEVASRLFENASLAIKEAAAVLISDYGYGTASIELVRHCISEAKELEIPVIVDSRFRLTDLRNATAATPNQDEVEAILGEEISDKACDKLRNDLGYRALLVTCGSKGSRLYEEGHEPFYFPAVGSTDPVDVTGAGDTVIAAFSLALVAGANFRTAADIANHAGGIVVMKKGTAVVTADELEASLRTLAAGATY